jgi:predicted dehydrogenase
MAEQQSRRRPPSGEPAGAGDRLVRLGFVGCGNHATQNLYPSLRYAAARLVAVADPKEERRSHNARVFGAERAYDDYRPMIEREELDAILVSGPAELHHEVATHALGAGLHVFAEKPPAPDLSATRELAALAHERDAIFGVGFMKRSAQKYVHAKGIVASSEFGRLRHALVRYSYNVDNGPERVYAYVSIHAIDLIRFFLGPITSVSIAYSGGERENASCLLTAESGAVGTLVVNASAPGVTERVELTGDETMVIVDEVATLEYLPRQSENRWRPLRREVHRPNTALQTVDNDALELQGYRGEVVSFVDAVAARVSGRFSGVGAAGSGSREAAAPQPGATIDDAVAAMTLVDLLASRTGGYHEVNL